MNKRFALSALVAAILAAPAAHAADDIDLTITGTIRPSACVPTLAAGGIVDFGPINAQALNQTSNTTIPRRDVALTVTCSVPALWALSSVDARADSVTAVGDLRFGLGKTPNDENIGFYGIVLKDILIDGNAGRGLWSNNGGGTWNGASQLYSSASHINSFALTGTLTPIPSAVTSLKLDVAPFIYRADGLTLTDAVSLDGLASISIVYL